jgi:hypothetical protein
VPVTLSLTLNSRELAALHYGNIARAIARALRKAGSTALRDMRSEASKRVRARKRLKAAAVRKALHLRRPRRTTVDGMTFALDVEGKPVPLSAYPHRQTKRGVSVSVNRDKRTLVRSAFIATMSSGHTGVFMRRGPERLPIRELLGSRPVDALLHEGEAEAVAERGARSLRDTFTRLLPVELEKGRA